jgi:hypothetical protein
MLISFGLTCEFFNHSCRRNLVAPVNQQYLLLWLMTEMENDLVPFQVEATSDVQYLPMFTLVD